MKTREWTMENRGRMARSVVDCGGKRSATPLSAAGQTIGHVPSSPSAVAATALPAQSKTWRIFSTLVIFFIGFNAHAQSYSIDWFKIAGGGGMQSTGGVFAVSGTIGQHDASRPMTNGTYSLTGGFWSLYAVQTPGAPTLNIVPASPGFATVSWTPASTNWVLQENLNLGTTNWVNSFSGATNPVVVPATVPKKFYRLFKP